MNSDYIKNKRQAIPVVLLGVSVLLGVLTVVKVAGFFVTSARAQSLVKKAVAQNRMDPNDVAEHLAEAKAIADGLKKKNLFAPPEPKRNPVSVVSGILGDEVLINGKWYKAGDSVGDAKVVAIEPTRVRIEWDAKEETFAPISAASSDGIRTTHPRGGPVNYEREKQKKMAAGHKYPKAKPSVTLAEKKQLVRTVATLSEKLRAKSVKERKKALEEQKQYVKKLSNSMRKKEQQQLKMVKQADVKKRRQTK
ncbi:MAG: hypothetical protein KAY65_00300 [Planctomycetes bacterium]|nr:hypothetical protein [Planctomycetota bacterium]